MYFQIYTISIDPELASHSPEADYEIIQVNSGCFKLIAGMLGIAIKWDGIGGCWVQVCEIISCPQFTFEMRDASR